MADEPKVTAQFNIKGAEAVNRDLSVLRNILTLNANSAKELDAELKKFGLTASQVNTLINRLHSVELKGTAQGFSKLTAEEQAAASKLQGFAVEAKNTSGVMGALNQIAGKMGINLGALVNPITLIATVLATVAAIAAKATVEFAKFAQETLKLANEEDKHRAAVIAVAGSIGEGEEAYRKWDERVRDSNLPKEIYNVQDYAKALNKGLGPALMDAEEAFRGTSLSADGFIKQLSRMQAGYAPMRRSIFEYMGVLKEAGLTIEEVTSKETDHRAQAELLKEALARVAERQREAASTTVAGSIDEIKNRWKDYKEELGHILNKALGPILVKVKEIFFEFMKTGDVVRLFKDLANVLSENKEEIIVIAKEAMGIATAIIHAVSATIRLAQEFGLVHSALEAVGSVMMGIKTTLQGIVWLAEKYWEIQTLGIHKARSWEEIAGGGPDMGVTTGGGGYDWGALAEEYKAASPERKAAIESEARRRGASSKDIDFMKRRASELTATGFEEGGEGGGGRDRISEIKKRTAAQSKLRLTQKRTPGQEISGQSESEIAAAEAARREELLATAEEIANTINPTQAIIEGFKSGDMKSAITDFATGIGEAVAQKLVSALIMAGVLAVLNILSGGGTGGLQAALGSGGIIRAAEGFIGTFPPVPGGYYTRFGKHMINFSERGRAETLAVLPDGSRGRDLITGPLAAQFGIPTVNVSPQNNINTTVKVQNYDPRGVSTATTAATGKVNKAVTVRSGRVD